MSRSDWHNVSRKEPCPICHKTDWCSVSNDGVVCVCHRIESPYPTKGGTGWIHRLRDEPKSKFGGQGEQWRFRCHSAPLHPEPKNNPVAAEYFAALPKGEIQRRLCLRLERDLGLPKEMLEMHDVRWDPKAYAVAFPMRNAEGEVTGIRYRQLGTGRKWALKGSKDGLFYMPGFNPAYEELVVCEGPTDMLAAASAGLNAVGRSSCMTGAALLRQFIRDRHIKHVTIIGDNDKPHDRPDGTWWRPGLDGAEKLARDLRVSARIVLPPPEIKDTREWYRSGLLTKELFKKALAGAKWIIGGQVV